MALVIREKNVTVTVSDTFERIARAAAQDVAPGVLDTMERELGAVLDDARASWPVRTGVSREGLALETALDRDLTQVSVKIRNDVPYAVYVRPAALYGATTAWERFVRKPARKAVQGLIKILGPRITGALRGR